MYRKNASFFALLFLLLLSACSKQLKPNELPAGVQIGQVYYTQFSLFQEENKFRTTNYRKGILIPINTAVSLVSIDSDEVNLKLSTSGLPLRIENVQKFTKDDMPTAFLKIAGLKKVDLTRFAKIEQDNILVGRVIKGMSKKAVLAAIGYPPQHVTPSLEGNDWTYWSNLFNRFVIHFKNDKVEDIVD
jgi:outer membrane protein assembly factor BamE (lipoprotein component of BamABCDE complex)